MPKNTPNFKRVTVVSLATAFLSIPALADNVPKTRTITTVRTYSDWAAIIYSPSYDNNVGCSSTHSTNTAVIEWRSDPDKKAMYAAILGAALVKQPVGFGITGCWSGYGGGVPLIYRVDIDSD